MVQNFCKWPRGHYVTYIEDPDIRNMDSSSCLVECIVSLHLMRLFGWCVVKPPSLERMLSVFSVLLGPVVS